MNFHFPLMPRMFMSLQMEDRFPIIDILEQTPSIPEQCQWAMFLRNHDGLTLEMVTDEERDYMYRVYATDPHARINLGIRRRLAPLLANSRRKIELLNTLLSSMPGTPIIYYGDEIGMGDNFYLGDRNGCRTPMQWSPDRNAGFSRANPQQLYLPVTIDPEYHYEAVNVENQQKNLSSLLWWTRCPKHQRASSVRHPAWRWPARPARARGPSQSHPQCPLVWFQSTQFSEPQSDRAASGFAQCRRRATLVGRGKLSGCPIRNVHNSGRDCLRRKRTLHCAECASSRRSAFCSKQRRYSMRCHLGLGVSLTIVRRHRAASHAQSSGRTICRRRKG